MSGIDWAVVIVFLVGVAGIGLWATKKGSGSMADFFVAGRSLPWWLAGTSMLATSFSSDTPLHATRMIRENGLGGAWFYWGGILSGGVIAFFFARLWRRTGVMTDAEFVELRYAGKSAAVLRGAIALFRGSILEILTLSWVTLGMTKLVRVVVVLPDSIDVAGLALSTDVLLVAALLIVALIYTLASGLWGVVVTDLVEFGVAMLGAIILAVLAMVRVGGPSGLRAGLEAQNRGQALDFFPSLDGNSLPFLAVGVYLGVQWWASPYIDGSGQRAQRFLACRDERQALLAGVWNMAVQWVFRTWPWYLAALASIVIYPSLTDPEKAYPQLINDLLPAGLRGLMVAAFFAAFMSTFDSLLNLSASYVSNDVYRRFMKPGQDERHYVRASRIVSIVIALIVGTLALLLPSVLAAFRLKMELMAGLGLVSVARWFWWRINAATELATLVVSVVVAGVLSGFPSVFLSIASVFGMSSLDPDSALASAFRLLLVVGVSSVTTVATAFLTRPEPEAKLVSFYERVRPPAMFWGPIPSRAAVGEASLVTAATFGQFAVCIVFVFAGMFGVGKLCLGEYGLGVLLVLVSAVSFGVLYRWVLRAPVAQTPPPPAAPVVGAPSA